MQFDIFTLAITLSITSFLQVMMLYFTHKSNKGIRGIRCWIVGYACVALGTFLQIMREIISIKFLTIVSGNVLILVGLLIVYTGILRFLNIREKRMRALLIIIIFILAMTYFTYIFDSIVIRTYISTISYSIVLIYVAVRLFSNKDSSIKESTRFLAAVYAFEGAYFITRFFAVLILSMSSNYFEPSPLQVSLYSVSIIVCFLSTFGLVNMVNQRLGGETKEANERLEIFFYNSPDATAITRISDGLIENVNEGFTVLTGYGRDEAIGKTANELGLWENIEDRNDIIKELNEKGYSENKDILFCKKNGEFYYGNFSASLIYLKGIPHIISTNRDMTDDRARQKEIENLSYHDYLTGIYNRRYYEKAAGNVDRKSNLPISIILIDVNDLKYINDKYGHEVGDKALQRTALAIKSACREDDIVARWGGDEFVVLLQRTDDDKLEKIISRIKENILNEKNGVVDISVSLGYKTKTDMGESINSVFIDAEKQMYSNKVVFKSKRK